MGMIFITQKSKKPANKKSGWQKEAQAYAEWQSKIASMSSGISGVRQKATLPKASKVAEPKVANILPGRYVVGSGTLVVHRPEIKYRDSPELLERELAARAVKHNSAPAFNKGGDQYVTEEALQQLLSSNKRRS